jgi:hypothetical protein
MTTTTLHARDAGGIFHETPEPIHAACLKLLDARRASVAAAGKRFPEEISYAEMMRIRDDGRTASAEVERVIGDHQGASFLSGFYRVDGWLVGFRKINKCGLTLVVYPTDEIKRGMRS